MSVLFCSSGLSFFFGCLVKKGRGERFLNFCCFDKNGHNLVCHLRIIFYVAVGNVYINKNIKLMDSGYKRYQ